MPPPDSSFEQWRRADFVPWVDGLVVDDVATFTVEHVGKVPPMRLSEDEVACSFSPDEQSHSEEQTV